MIIMMIIVLVRILRVTSKGSICAVLCFTFSYQIVFSKGKKVSVITKVFRNTVFPN